jgi:hypothetical protein
MIVRLVVLSGMLAASTMAGHASAPADSTIHTSPAVSLEALASDSAKAPALILARRGADDPPGDDRGGDNGNRGGKGGKGGGKGGKGRGGHDDGPGHT